MSLGTTCKETHRLASEGMDRSLTFGERARMRVHLLGCEACRNFEGQLRLLREAMRRMTPGDDEDAR
ncbi:MAG TPA: zf-HC2 domain-containing protein [Noviherbaspirillum sp.]|jgi:predicted anti-sigma-YlaC factor YlaD|uniref:zf-HC2 domain-containing protein n=1 Tax=Noviherbaspirillum sp. TaxID=1926288 RepID=UPI002F95DCE9